MVATALTIAGSDPSGGAGLQADLKTFQQFQVYGMSVVTLITAQNSTCVSYVEVLPANLVSKQLEAVLSDIQPQAVKIGALGNSEIIKVVAGASESFHCPLVIDPVIVSTQGESLLDAKAIIDLKKILFPRCDLLTPNVIEAQQLTGIRCDDYDDFLEVAKALQQLGPKAVLIKGGHLSGELSRDFLWSGNRFNWFDAKRVDTPHTHGTGCTLSAAISAGLAKGNNLESAVTAAKAYISQAIKNAPGLGKGNGPIGYFEPEISQGVNLDNRCN